MYYVLDTAGDAKTDQTRIMPEKPDSPESE